MAGRLDGPGRQLNDSLGEHTHLVRIVDDDPIWRRFLLNEAG